MATTSPPVPTQNQSRVAAAAVSDIRSPSPLVSKPSPAPPVPSRSFIERIRPTRVRQRSSGLLVSQQTAPEVILAVHEQAQKDIRLATTARTRDMQKLARRIAHTSSVMFFIVFAIAGLMDLFGLMALAVEAIPYLGAVFGFVVNLITTPITLLCVTVPMLFAQYRIRRINRNVEAVHTYTAKLSLQAAEMRKNLLPAMREMRRPYLATSTDPSSAGGAGEFVRYRSRILLNNILVLLLEAIPYINAGPWQTLKVWRVYVHQQKEFRRARIVFLEAEALTRRISLLERFYVEYLEFAFQRNLARLLGERRRVQPRRPITERVYATAQETKKRVTQSQQANAPPIMRDVVFAT